MERRGDVLILGAGLAGLSAGHELSRAGLGVRIVERQPAAGGLARTVARGPFRFDLGGHRFLTRDRTVEGLVRSLLGRECLTVPRRSQILLGGRYIDYPLSPGNAISGLGASTVWRIVLDHARERLRARSGTREPASLEDWVVGRFGRALFDIYFKEYSEKVWGIDCRRISSDWVAERIQGLSLGAAVRNAFFRSGGSAIKTLSDRFLYPSRGIGMIAERLQEELGTDGEVLCGVEVARLRHDGRRVEAALVRDGRHTRSVEAEAFVSTVPLTDLVRMLDPRPPMQVLAAAARLRFRDLVVVAVMLDRERATDQSWLYFPERRIPFGRIHEPTNWSARMAPEGRTLLVAEQFCFRWDDVWRSGDRELGDRAVESLHGLGIVSRREVLDTAVLRVPDAYPLFEVGYREHRDAVLAYLGTFRNLFPAGRGGTFRYFNMDHAIASGLEAARRILGGDAAHLGDLAGAVHPRREASARPALARRSA
ncbi:MAG TPA: FAD-dependent oxidoreductase [Anaeromyxobacteraceae bacterium]|jgi:protoporphyrinogen oxidase